MTIGCATASSSRDRGREPAAITTVGFVALSGAVIVFQLALVVGDLTLGGKHADVAHDASRTAPWFVVGYLVPSKRSASCACP